MRFLGPKLQLKNDVYPDERLCEVMVLQQHYGGSSLCVFRELLPPNSKYWTGFRVVGKDNFVSNVVGCLVRNTKVYKIRKLYRTIFSTFYNILQPNVTIV